MHELTTQETEVVSGGVVKEAIDWICGWVGSGFWR